MQPRKTTKVLVDSINRNPNFIQEITVNLIVGNDGLGMSGVYGSFKEVKLWSTIRSDPELFTFRVR